MELQDIVRRLRMTQSIKAIKRETGKHRRVIRKVLEFAEQEGWLDDERELPSEHQLQAMRLSSSRPPALSESRRAGTRYAGGQAAERMAARRA